MKSEPLVAVVDDDLRVLEAIEDLLESAGRAVAAFRSGEALLSAPALAHIACLISDIAMPGMDGFELQRRLHALRPGLPVIFLTGHELTGAALARARQSHGLLRKPFDSTELLAAVSRALRGSPS